MIIAAADRLAINTNIANSEDRVELYIQFKETA